MSLQKLKTLHHICELERTQLLPMLTMSVQNPQVAGYRLTLSMLKVLLLDY